MSTNTICLDADVQDRDEQTELQLAALREGGLHFCEGPLRRRRHRAQTKVNKWKQKWFKVEPGKEEAGMKKVARLFAFRKILASYIASYQQILSFPSARRGKDAYQLTESQGKEQSGMAKLLLSLPTSAPGSSGIRTSSLSTDAASEDYTGFSIYRGALPSGELLSTFRAEDIVQQRGFMAALGATGPGLFSRPPQNSEASSKSGCSARLRQLLHRQKTYNARSQNSQLAEVYKNIPRSFQEALQTFPSEFYFPNSELPSPVLPGVKLQNYDPSQTDLKRVPCSGGKIEFRPPHGSPTNYPSIIGCGAAAGLESGQTAVWDQENELYYFLDCNKKIVTANDPRQRKSFRPQVRTSQITVHKKQAEANLSLPACHPDTVRATAQRAARKPHGCILRACGKKGRHGMSAKPSADGHRGGDGLNTTGELVIDGGDGGDGANGRDGRHAEPGEDGGMGRNVIVELYGDAKDLGIAGTCQSVARLGGDECEEVLLVDCSGGDGGDGGNGGRGGRGGDGGDGGRGSSGGDGGHGGDGAHGGRGGSGGNAGCGGRGGNCIVRVVDPRLLMLVEVDCDSGLPGKAGRGGRGGSGGNMGLGGPASNSEGLQGKPGRSGDSGEDGLDGEPGFAHKPGSVEWAITTEDGGVTHSASTRFEAEVVTMDLTSCGQDEVFEPHQQIRVTNMTVVNSGGLPLPAGAKVSIPSMETVRFEPTTFTLPGLEPGEQFIIPAVFRGRIVDEPSPNTPGPLSHEAKFAPRIDLLGRPFERSRLEQSVAVQYPVNLAYTLAKKNVCCGEVTMLEIGIENTSSSSHYGRGSQSRGSVLIHILLDPRLHLLGICPSSSDRERMFEASYDPNNPSSLFVLVKELKPGAILSVPIVARLQGEVGETLRWQTELYLRGKLVEYNFSEIRVAPAYSPSSSPSQQLSDVLFIKSECVGEREMFFWQRIFELLEVSFDYWDSSSSDGDNYNQSLPPFRESYRGKLVVFPHCDLTKLTADDIVNHFRGDEQDRSQESSMLLFLSTPAPESLESYVTHGQGSKIILRHICGNEPLVEVPPELYSGRHLVSPGTVLPVDWTLQKAQRTVLKKLEKDAPSHLPMITGHSSLLRRQGLSYSYGKLHVRRCPLPRTANFQCVDGAASQMIMMGADDPHLTETSREIPLASHFGQVFLATLAGLPFRLKMKLLQQSSSPLHVQFCLPNSATLTKRDLAAICMARDIVDEALAGSSDLGRIRTLTNSVKDACSSSREIFAQLLDCVRREASQRQSTLGRNLTQVSKSLKHLSNLCSSTDAYLPSLVSSKPRPFPLLSVLQDRLAVLRPHQLTTNELFDLSADSSH